MKLVWSEESKNDKWLQVELAVCEAWTEEGVIPLEDMVAASLTTFRILESLASAASPEVGAEGFLASSGAG